MLWPQLKLVELPLRQVLHAPDQLISEVLFPETDCTSMLAYMFSPAFALLNLLG
jgi:hypothetical protein